MLLLKQLQLIRKFIFSDKCCICNNFLSKNSYYLCFSCKKRIQNKIYLRKFKNFYFLFNYDNDIKILIKNYKLYNQKYIGLFLSHLIKESLQSVILQNDIDLIIPVPLSNSKFLDRGFNQITFILDFINIKYKNIIRCKKTFPMSKLKNINARRLNIKSSFIIPFNTHNKKILIIDDIITTGSTIKEIIKELNKKGKPKSIFIFSISAANSFYKNISSF